MGVEITNGFVIERLLLGYGVLAMNGRMTDDTMANWTDFEGRKMESWQLVVGLHGKATATGDEFG